MYLKKKTGKTAITKEEPKKKQAENMYICKNYLKKKKVI